MIDWDKVNELRDEVGAEDFEEIVELFLEEVGELIDRLHSLEDRSSLGKDLHFLKGSASNLGFQTLSEQCHVGEQQAESGEQDHINLEEVLETYRLSKEMFLDRLPTLNAA